MKKYKIDKWAIIITLALVAVFSVYIILMPTAATEILNNIRIFITTKMGVYFIVITIGIFVFNFAVAFSKFGNIKLGKDKPEYKTFSWIAMIFCATMGAALLYWAVLEWVYYYITPPQSITPESIAAAQVAVSYNFFHWGVPAWGIYAIGTIPLAYRFYVRRQEGLSLANGCEGVTGGRPIWNKIINIIFIFGIVSGIILTFGTGVPMLVNNLHTSLGTPDNFIMQVVMVVAVTIFFTASSYAGLEKGMKFCSDSTIYLCFFLLAYVFIFGGPQFQLENTIKSFGMMLSNFVPMITETEPIIKTGFTADWTVFYWAWWITLAPWMWIFIAKISKGRTIKEVILSITGAGMLSTLLFFGVLSNYGLQLQLTGSFNLSKSSRPRVRNRLFQRLSRPCLSGKSSCLYGFSLAPCCSSPLWIPLSLLCPRLPSKILRMTKSRRTISNCSGPLSFPRFRCASCLQRRRWILLNRPLLYQRSRCL